MSGSWRLFVRRVVTVSIVIVGAGVAGFLAAAPSVDELCDRIVSHGPASTRDDDRQLCLRRYQTQAEREGAWAFAETTWCARFAESIDEIGRCI